MVTHWDSSKRPLYVKTVWKDGQHHVVLHDEHFHPRRKTEKSLNSARAIKSATAPYSSNLNVSSIQLLNTSTSTLSEPPRRCRTTVKNHQKVPFKHMQKQVSFSVPLEDKTNNFGLSIKSNSIDIGDSRTAYQAVDRPEDNFARYITYKTFIEPSSNSLSERVLVWLDLATQNPTSFDLEKDQPLRVVTAQPVTKKKQNNFSRHRCLSSCQPIALDAPQMSFQAEGVCQSLQFANDSILNNRHRGNFEDDAVVFEEKSAADMLVSSEVEKNYVPDDVEDKECARKSFGVKRQLHIFMPDLPKKFSDCDSSLLSSKLSGCSLQKNCNRIL